MTCSVEIYSVGNDRRWSWLDSITKFSRNFLPGNDKFVWSLTNIENFLVQHTFMSKCFSCVQLLKVCYFILKLTLATSMEIFACSSSNEDCMLLIGLAMSKQQRKKKPKMWVRDLLKQRKQSGVYWEIAMADKEMFFRYMRMSPSTFE